MEAAIVLGVIGLVIGGIWVAAAAVQSNLRKSDASKGLIQIVQNVRNLYYGQSPSAGGDVTTQLINANAIPGNFISGANAINPWNGAITVSIAGAGFDQIDVTMDALPRDACIEMTSRNTNISTGIGLTQITISGPAGGGPVITSFPYLPTAAAGDCNDYNIITWRFGIRG